MKAWLKYADPRTSLLPERLPQLKPEDKSRRYTPHNSGADLYTYLILTAHLTDPDLYHGALLEMLRNEVRYTDSHGFGSGQPGSQHGRVGSDEPVWSR